MLPLLARAGAWFLGSGIQESNGGVARYYRTDLARNNPVSTEITGYAASALAYLYELSGEPRYLARAVAAADFLVATAWDRAQRAMPFEIDPADHTYFFDCGIIIRGLLAVWRITKLDGYLTAAAEIGTAMAHDFAAPDGAFHPILRLPGKTPLERDGLRWSRYPGCYQLKSAMAWLDLFEATGEARFCESWECAVDYSLRTWAGFLPGHPERLKVMDRLHAFSYFMEALLARPEDARARAALCEGIGLVASLLREIAPEFERSDVYAQLLRARLYAHAAGAVPLDTRAAAEEAAALAEFQAADPDPRIDGGFWFGRRAGEWLPFSNPVSTAFAMQALALWEQHRAGETLTDRRLLI